jgi:hypothetical protein
MEDISQETARERVEQKIAAIKQENDHDGAIYDKVDGRVEFIKRLEYGPWDNVPEEEKLYILQNRPNWEGVSPSNKDDLIRKEIDFSRIAPEKQIEITGEVWSALEYDQLDLER